jgi:hypothetical protein
MLHLGVQKFDKNDELKKEIEGPCMGKDKRHGQVRVERLSLLSSRCIYISESVTPVSSDL